jgi:hypothetical protein
MLVIDARSAFVASTFGIGLLAVPFLAKHDVNHLVAGLRCSILTEEQISFVLESPVRLLPANDESACIYATTSRVQEVIVTVHADDRPPLIRIVGDDVSEATRQSEISALQGLIRQNLAQAPSL